MRRSIEIIIFCAAGITSIWIGYGLFKISIPFLSSPLLSVEYRSWRSRYNKFKECVAPFEKAMYEERTAGELSVSRLKELMVATQRRVFGDLLEEGGEDPYFWASKLHFYITGTSFYNFPYTFGFLLSRGLYSRFCQEGTSFLPKYAEFLRSTGGNSAETVARDTIDCDLESTEFWVAAIRSLEQPLHQLKQLIPGLSQGD